MCKVIFFIPLMFILTSLPADSAPSPPEHELTPAVEPGTGHASGQILVKFKETEKTGALRADQYTALSEAAADVLDRTGASVAKSYPNTGIHLIDIAPVMTVQEAMEEMLNSGMVEFAEPNYLVHADRLPNDPLFSQQWGLLNAGSSDASNPMTADADIDAPEAWNLAVDASPTIVVIIDSGVDFTHPDLAANIWTNPGEVNGQANVDDDGNLYTDDVNGINTAEHNSNPMDIDGHGTHCAGTIGAVGNNKAGITGVAWKSKIMPLKFMAHESGYISNAIECINYALAIKSKYSYTRMIFSLSWGWEGASSQSLYDALKAAKDAGVLVVTSAGNTGKNSDLAPHYPSSYDLENIIRVGGSDANDQRASWSNYGIASVDLFAPGVKILSTAPGNSYKTLSGTSTAAPFVTGAAALIWSSRPDLGWADVKALILNGAETAKSPTALQGTCLTQGRLNLRMSMVAARNDDPAVFSISPTVGCEGELITVTGNGFGDSFGAYGNDSTVQLGKTSLPWDSIISWTPDTILLRLPAALPFGSNLLKVNTPLGNARGGCFRSGMAPGLAGTTVMGHAFAASAQIGKDLWIMGGLTSTGQTGAVELYDLLSGNSAMPPEMPIPLTYAAAVAVGKQLFVVGGLDWNTGRAFNRLQIFDIGLNMWSPGSTLPFGLYQAAVTTFNNRVYAFGGTNGQRQVVRTTLLYDPQSNSWIRRANMPVAVTYASAVPIQGTPYIMVVGGSSQPGGGKALNTVQLYDAMMDRWQIGSPLPKARYGAAALFSGSAFCLFGTGTDGMGFSDGEYLNGNTWQTAVFSSGNLVGPVAAQYSDMVYIVGGQDPATGTISNNVLTLHTTPPTN